MYYWVHPEWEEALICDRELKDRTVPPEPLLSPAQVSQWDDLSPADLLFSLRCVELFLYTEPFELEYTVETF